LEIYIKFHESLFGGSRVFYMRMDGRTDEIQTDGQT